MQSFDPPQLFAALERSLPPAASGRLCVAFSGGLDSSVLLHALAHAVPAQSRYRLRALYVDHQLQAQSGAWREHCSQACASLGVPFRSLTVAVRSAPGTSLEAEARQARYAAFAAELAPQETLLTAHHADDQLETVLLALLRGSGIRGLAAMPVQQPLGPGWHARPLLEFTRAALQQWARDAALHWISDPSNEGLRFDRNYLRHLVVPRLQERWPAAALSIARSAGHAAEAEHLLEQLARSDAVQAMAGSCLRVSQLAALDGARRRNLLRYWLRSCGAGMPSARKLAGLEHDMLAAAGDRVPCTQWDRVAVRRHRDLLYCTPRQLMSPPEPRSWDWTAPLSLGELGVLHMVPGAAGGLATARLPPQVLVAFRPAAEMLLGRGSGGQRKLKKLLQKSAVLPWWRDCVPLVSSAGALLSVGDWWVSEKFAARAHEPAVCVHWQGAPAVRAPRAGLHA